MEAISRGGSEASPRDPAGQPPTEGAWGAVGRLYEMVRKSRANPLWPPVGPDRRGDTQEVTKKPASPWRPVSRRGKLDQRQEEDVAGLNRFARLLLAGQPGQPQLVMHPHQRVHLRSLLMIGHNKLCAPRPISRMPPLQKPSVSTPIRRRPPLPHCDSHRPIFRGAGSGNTFDEGATLRSLLDPGQRLQRPYRAPARVVALRNLRKASWVNRRPSEERA